LYLAGSAMANGGSAAGLVPSLARAASTAAATFAPHIRPFSVWSLAGAAPTSVANRLSNCPWRAG